MRVRLLRGDDDNTVLLVYPATRDEHCRVLDTVGCPGGSQGRSRPAGGAYVVTTAAQRERWGLADLAASGRVRVVDEAQALGLLCDGAAGLGAAEAPLAGAAPRFRRRLAAGPSLRRSSPCARWPPPARASIRCSRPWRPPSCPVRRVRRCGAASRRSGPMRRRSTRRWTGRRWCWPCRGERASRSGSTRRMWRRCCRASGSDVFWTAVDRSH